MKHRTWINGRRTNLQHLVKAGLESAGVKFDYKDITVRMSNETEEHRLHFHTDLTRDGKAVVIIVYSSAEFDRFIPKLHESKERDNTTCRILAIDLTPEEVGKMVYNHELYLEDICDMVWPLPKDIRPAGRNPFETGYKSRVMESVVAHVRRFKKAVKEVDTGLLEPLR